MNTRFFRDQGPSGQDDWAVMFEVLNQCIDAEDRKHMHRTVRG